MQTRRLTLRYRLATTPPRFYTSSRILTGPSLQSIADVAVNFLINTRRHLMTEANVFILEENLSDELPIPLSSPKEENTT